MDKAAKNMFEFLFAPELPHPRYDCYITFLVEEEDLILIFSREAQALRDQGFLGQETRFGAWASFQLDFLHLQDAGFYINLLDACGVKWSMTVV